MKVEIELTKAQAQKIFGEALVGKVFTAPMRIESMSWESYGSSITVTATDEPEVVKEVDA